MIAAAGVVLRVVWFQRYGIEHQLVVGLPPAGDFWAYPPHEWRNAGDVAFDELAAVRAFAPGYGAVIRGAWELAGGSSGDTHTFRVVILAAQSLIVAAATLLTFALSRRVIFGFAALLPAALMTASVALLELPGHLAPQFPLMFLLVAAIWLVTLLRERVPDLRGAGPVLLTIAAGATMGAAILFSPAALLLVPFICWWAFRGIGREHATLLLVATILLPACWLAVVQTQATGGVPTDQITAWADQGGETVVNSASAAADRAYAFITPWNPRFARGGWASANWNYEWILPQSFRSETTYISATRTLAVVLMLAYLALVLGGVIALFAEGAGSAERLIALPVITLPLATFLSTAGDLWRAPILPFLMISLVVGAIWLLEIGQRKPRVAPPE